LFRKLNLVESLEDERSTEKGKSLVNIYHFIKQGEIKNEAQKTREAGRAAARPRFWPPE
jgi:hypothetical protein